MHKSLLFTSFGVLDTLDAMTKVRVWKFCLAYCMVVNIVSFTSRFQVYLCGILPSSFLRIATKSSTKFAFLLVQTAFVHISRDTRFIFQHKTLTFHISMWKFRIIAFAFLDIEEKKQNSWKRTKSWWHWVANESQSFQLSISLGGIKWRCHSQINRSFDQSTQNCSIETYRYECKHPSIEFMNFSIEIVYNDIVALLQWPKTFQHLDAHDWSFTLRWWC